MAYLRELPRPRCIACGRAAHVELINQRNAECGAYCRQCGKCVLAKMQADEARLGREVTQ